MKEQDGSIECGECGLSKCRRRLRSRGGLAMHKYKTTMPQNDNFFHTLIFLGGLHDQLLIVVT